MFDSTNFSSDVAASVMGGSLRPKNLVTDRPSTQAQNSVSLGRNKKQTVLNSSIGAQMYATIQDHKPRDEEIWHSSAHHSTQLQPVLYVGGKQIGGKQWNCF